MKYSLANEEWSHLKDILQEGDVLSYTSIRKFARGLVELEDKLDFCLDKGIMLYDEKYQMEVDPNFINDYYDFLRMLKNESHRRRQLEGIQNALALKQEGKGAYGRPLANLPVDFEEKIVQLKKTHKPLEDYRKTTGMKKSTFYKYAKTIIVEEDDE